MPFSIPESGQFISSLGGRRGKGLIPAASDAVNLVLPTYAEMLAILGATGIIIPLGDSDQGAFSGSTLTTQGLSHTFTASANWNAWDTAPGTQGAAPTVTFNGTDEYATSPDADTWTVGTGLADGVLSMGAWVNFASITGEQFIMGKSDGAEIEWRFYKDSNHKRFMYFRDKNQGKFIRTSIDALATASTWAFIVFTYDGSEAPTGIIPYLDGVAVAHTDEAEVGYDAMENTTAQIAVGANNPSTPASLFNGKMAGGPLGPFFCKKELSAAEVLSLYNKGAAALGL